MKTIRLIKLLVLVSIIMPFISKAQYTGGSGSGSAMAESTQNALPVKILSFKAHCKESHIEIKWQTATEINNDYFTLQRSSNASDWEDIAEIKGSGNSNAIINYSIRVENPHSSSLYRLRQTDYDGQFSFSDIIHLKCNSTSNLSNDLKVFPNPSDGIFYISGVFDEVNYTVYNIVGEKVKSGVLNNEVSKLDMSAYAKGIYTLMIHSQDERIVRRIVVQ